MRFLSAKEAKILTDKQAKRILKSINIEIKEASKIPKYHTIHEFNDYTDLNLINKIINYLRDQGYSVEWHNATVTCGIYIKSHIFIKWKDDDNK